VNYGQLAMCFGPLLLYLLDPSIISASCFQLSVLTVGVADMNPWRSPKRKKKETDR
jgi:hypothetical protein